MKDFGRGMSISRCRQDVLSCWSIIFQGPSTTTQMLHVTLLVVLSHDGTLRVAFTRGLNTERDSCSFREGLINAAIPHS